MDFGERLNEILKEKKLSQAAFARQIEENKVTVNQVIKGSRAPSLGFMMKVFEFFPDIDLNWLLRGIPISDRVNDKEEGYGVPETPDVLIENIEKNLMALKAKLAQK